MAIQELRETLDWLVGPEGWIGEDQKSTPIYEQTLRLLDSLERGVGGIGHGFAAQYDAEGENPAKPEEAYRAQNQRSAMLALILGHELRRLIGVRSEAVSLKWVLRHVTVAMMDSSAGLRAESRHVQDPVTKTFFHDRVGNQLDKIDNQFPTAMRKHVPTAYDPASARSVLAWGQAWSACCCATYLDWGYRAGLTSSTFVRRMWPGAEGFTRLCIGGTVLPTGEHLHVELHVSPLIGQIIEGRPEFFKATNKLVQIAIPMHRYDYRSGGGDARTATYMGRDVRQLYAAVLAQGLAELNARLLGGVRSASAGPEHES